VAAEHVAVPRLAVRAEDVRVGRGSAAASESSVAPFRGVEIAGPAGSAPSAEAPVSSVPAVVGAATAPASIASLPTGVAERSAGNHEKEAFASPSSAATVAAVVSRLTDAARIIAHSTAAVTAAGETTVPEDRGMDVAAAASTSAKVFSKLAHSTRTAAAPAGARESPDLILKMVGVASVTTHPSPPATAPRMSRPAIASIAADCTVPVESATFDFALTRVSEDRSTRSKTSSRPVDPVASPSHVALDMGVPEDQVPAGADCEQAQDLGARVLQRRSMTFDGDRRGDHRRGRPPEHVGRILDVVIHLENTSGGQHDDIVAVARDAVRGHEGGGVVDTFVSSHRLGFVEIRGVDGFLQGATRHPVVDLLLQGRDVDHGSRRIPGDRTGCQ